MQKYVLLVLTAALMTEGQNVPGGGGVTLPGGGGAGLTIPPAVIPVVNNAIHQQVSAQDNCPPQTDFSADLLLSSDPANYPVVELNAELALRPELSACLLREVVLPTAPTVPIDPVVTNSLDTCPSVTPTLWSYQRYGSRCWIIQNVQEIINFTVCGSVRCVGCNNFFTGSGHGSDQRCVRLYQYFSVWSYCQGLALNNRVVRERVILPYACVCQKVRCFTNSYHFWRKRK